MQTDTAAEYLVKMLNKQRTTVADVILSGNLAEAEYKRLSGILTGLQYAIDLIRDTAKKVANDEELVSDE
jgi:hypothetical protein